MKRGWWLTVVGVIAVILGVNIALAFANRDGGVVTGPAGSAAVTSPDGLAAWRTLLDRTDHDTRLLGRGLSGIEEQTTVVVNLPPYTPEALSPSDLDRIAEFVDDGGHVVVFGEVDIETNTFEGSVEYFADATRFDNDHLADGSNAADSLDLIRGSRVGFVEAQFGLGASEKQGLDTLPNGWVPASIAIIFVIVIGVASSGRALGAPDELDRPRPPARSLHVDALAGQIRKRLRQGTPAVLPGTTPIAPNPISNKENL